MFYERTMHFTCKQVATFHLKLTTPFAPTVRADFASTTFGCMWAKQL